MEYAVNSGEVLEIVAKSKSKHYASVTYFQDGNDYMETSHPNVLSNV